MKKIKSLKDILKTKSLVRLMGAHNAMTAKLVEKHGFEAIWASGLEISTSHAVPDANILTMRDFLEASSEMANSVSIPVVSDCDTGFGNSNNVIHMVKKFESVGISAVCIEDKKFPKVNSLLSGGRQELAPMAEFVGKIMAAKNVQKTKDFMVFARVEALIAGKSLNEALKRADAYIEAGADGIFIHSKSRNPDQIIEFCRKWEKKGILMICPTTYSSLSEKEMKKLGVDIVVYANHGIRASIKAVNNIYGHISRNGITDIDSKISGLSEVFEIQGMHLMRKDEEKYLKSEVGEVKVVIPAAGDKIDSSLKRMLEDRPIAMLDINGKSLIQRNVESLNNIGIRNINVVVGYRRENVDIRDVKIMKNTAYKTKGMMYSILKGFKNISAKNFIAYSDIIFDQDIIRKILNIEKDIILVVDGTYKKTHFRNKELELVQVALTPQSGIRTINRDRTNRILKIGKDLLETRADYEFIGLVCLSKRGMNILIEEYRRLKNDKISFIEMIQYLINKKHKITSYEVSEGWMEVHNFDDYKRACRVFLQ